MFKSFRKHNRYILTSPLLQYIAELRDIIIISINIQIYIVYCIVIKNVDRSQSFTRNLLPRYKIIILLSLLLLRHRVLNSTLNATIIFWWIHSGREITTALYFTIVLRSRCKNTMRFYTLLSLHVIFRVSSETKLKTNKITLCFRHRWRWR